jgi:hypothetical protein
MERIAGREKKAQSDAPSEAEARVDSNPILT